MNKLKFLCGLIILAFFASCGNDPLLEITQVKTTQTKSSTIDAIDVYVDCSGSMKGYVSFAANDAVIANQLFKTIVPTFVNNLKSAFGKDPVIYKIKDDSYTLESSITDFFSNLTNGNIFSGATTELDKIVKQIIDNQQKDSLNKVYVLITDGVLSFGPTILKNDKMYNIKNKAILQSNIHNALLKDKNLSLTIIKYISDFNGDYYYNCKEQVEFKGQLLTNRPFYFLIIGKKELVSSFLVKQNLLPQSEGIFTVSNPIELKIGIFKKKREPEKGKTNTLLQVKDKKGMVTATSSWEKGKDKVFIIGVNKDDVPNNFYTDDSFFDSLKCDEKSVTILKLDNFAVQDGVDDNSKIKNPFKTQDFDYFYKITIDKSMFDNNLDKKQLTFYFKPSLDITKTYSDIDYNFSNISSIENKTWGFNLITNAIQNANAGKIPQGAKFTLILNKTK